MCVCVCVWVNSLLVQRMAMGVSAPPLHLPLHPTGGRGGRREERNLVGEEEEEEEEEVANSSPLHIRTLNR